MTTIAMRLALVVLALSMATTARAEREPTLNERLSRDSFKALDEARKTKDYAPAIKAAQICVAQLQEPADDIEADLRKAGEPVIDPRHVGDSVAEREKIHRRGPLNDIGACLFVKVAAEAATNNAADAQKSYAQLCRYPHALVWDPNGWFWSPAKGARGELRAIGLTPALCPDEESAK